MFSGFIADALRQFIMLIPVAHLTALSSTRMELGVESCQVPCSPSTQACFFSALNPKEPSSRLRPIDGKGLDDEPRMVLYKHSYRPDHDVI